jgi:hypothetical protein
VLASRTNVVDDVKDAPAVVAQSAITRPFVVVEAHASNT